MLPACFHHGMSSTPTFLSSLQSSIASEAKANKAKPAPTPLPLVSSLPHIPPPTISSLPSPPSSHPPASSSSSTSSSTSASIPRASPRAAGVRTATPRPWPKPPELPPSLEGEELVSVPYDSTSAPAFKSAEYQQKMKAFTGASAHTDTQKEGKREENSDKGQVEEGSGEGWPSRLHLRVRLILFSLSLLCCASGAGQSLSSCQADHQWRAVPQIPASRSCMFGTQHHTHHLTPTPHSQSSTPPPLSMNGLPFSHCPPPRPLLPVLWELSDPHLRASPSQYPRKRYCDVSHLPAVYTDPSTRLHYYDAIRFAIVRSLSREQVNARLALRKAQLSEIK